MKNRIFLCSIFFIVFQLSLLAQSVKDKLSLIQATVLSGHIHERLLSSYEHHIMHRDVDALVAPFKVRNEKTQWQSEFWGKWFTSAVLAYRYHPDTELKKKLDYAVKELIATQSADGYIGNYEPGSRLLQWDIWGRKYCLLGLLDYYDLTRDQLSLQAAKRLADNLLADLAKSDGNIVTKGNYRGMAASSVLEPICLLYTRTKAKKYLDFAEEIVRQWETPEGPQLISKAGTDVAKRFAKPTSWYSWEQGQKAYEMMSCYEGLMELYRITGKQQYLEAVEKTWENIDKTEINAAGSGASAEMWFGGRGLQTATVHHYQETCVTVTWIKLGQQLLRLTGEAKYADAVERSYYNALLGSMSEDGVSWAKYTPLVGQRKPGSGQCGMDMNCCEASGPRGLFNLPSHIAMKTESGLQLNYYVSGTTNTKTPSGKVLSLIQETNYPENGMINIRLRLEKPETFILSLRIPEWSKITAVKINGEALGDINVGMQFLERRWKNGDQIELTLDMRGRVIWMGDKGTYAAIYRGPVLLARESRSGDADLTETLRPVTDKDGYLELKPETTPIDGIWLPYTAMFMPEYYTEKSGVALKVPLCDYSSAGNSAKHPFFKVWLPQVYDPRK